MEAAEIERVEAYLRKTLSNKKIYVKAPSAPDGPVEVYVGEEFIAVLYRDDDEGEVSYALTMTILEMDVLPES